VKVKQQKINKKTTLNPKPRKKIRSLNVKKPNRTQNNENVNKKKTLTLVPSDLVEESDQKDLMLSFWGISLAGEEGRQAGERERERERYNQI